MATRFYLPASAESTPIQFSESSEWEDVTLLTTGRAVARTTTIGNAMATVAFTDSNNANRDVLFRQYQSYPLTVGQIITGSQAIKAQARCLEVAAGNNMFLTVGLRVVNKSGTVSKVILAPTRDDTEAALTLTNRQLTATSTSGSYTTVDGDYLIIEVGMGGDPANSGGADHDSSIRFGDSAGSDLAEDNSSTTDNRPWVELATTLTFAPFSATASLTTGGTDFAASMTFTAAAIYDATASLTIGGAEFAASLIAGQHPVGKITQPCYGIFGQRSAGYSGKTLSPPLVNFSAALVTVPVGFAATMAYTSSAGGTADITTTGLTFSGSGLHAAAHSVSVITQPTFGVFGQRYGSFAGKGESAAATASLTTGGVEFAASATFFQPATADLTIGGVEFAASAQFFPIGALPHPVAKITQPTFGIFSRRYGSFAFKGGLFEATAALTTGGAEFAATAESTAPVFTTTAALTTGGTDFAATATFATVTRTATAALTTGGADFAAVATSIPIFTATATLTIGNAEFTASLTYESGVKTATTALSVGPLTFAASATFTPPVFTASAALITGAIEFAANDFPLAPTTAGLEFSIPTRRLHYTIMTGVESVLN